MTTINWTYDGFINDGFTAVNILPPLQHSNAKHEFLDILLNSLMQISWNMYFKNDYVLLMSSAYIRHNKSQDCISSLDTCTGDHRLELVHQIC